jgi:hypothetical protein
MKRRRNIKEDSNEVKPKHQLDKRWKRPAVASVVALLWMLPAAHSESRHKERDEGSPAGQTHLNYVIGYRRLSPEWGNARNQIVPGIVDFDIRPRSWPVSIAARLAFGYSSALPIGADPKASFSGSWDIDLGLRRVWWRFETLQPFVGAGLAVVGACTTVQVRTYPGAFYYQNWDSTTAGPFVETGFYVPVRRGLHTGVLLAYARGTGQLNGNAIQTGGTQVAFLFGKSWGGKHRPSATVH